MVLSTKKKNSIINVGGYKAIHRTGQRCPSSPASKTWVKYISGVSLDRSIIASSNKEHLQ